MVEVNAKSRIGRRACGQTCGQPPGNLWTEGLEPWRRLGIRCGGGPGGLSSTPLTSHNVVHRVCTENSWRTRPG
jgi:hypothetical protein